MDAAVRLLRDGRQVSGGPAALVLLTDDGETLGASAMLLQCTAALAAAAGAGRSQGRGVHGVAVERPPAELLAAGASSATDLFSDPCGWLSEPRGGCRCESDCGGGGGATGGTGGGGGASPWPASDLRRIAADAGAAFQPQSAAAAAAAAAAADADCAGCDSRCLVIDSLSALLLRHSAGQVLRLLDALQRCPAVSSVLALVHRDLHSPQLLCALQAAASASLDLSPLPPLQRQLAAAAGKPAPHGRARLAVKRRSGRVHAESQYYALEQDGGVNAYAPPPEALAAPDPRAIVESELAALGKSGGGGGGGGPAAAAAAATTAATAAAAGPVAAGAGPGSGGPADGGGGAAGADELTRRLGGVSMRLGLSEQERAERGRVVLPFERAAQLGGGGGGGEGAPRLGRILYERDSEGEADSDEDPDDDLDL
ncbi:hypothetical protein Rsub_05068 [Raphidocelis subcapitata]|uniref:Elongator complex protein 5 n=1 Tax=Raphidocelis subcapitata TaxID=307507 RepID=A0A2V0NZE8_9CHLO|nr:hypothetical protein Rsub_05068 [Raphidocelis subcapitata]|eukprot:GBF92699.1 hypothetical protein Rsub_05068 [Raphidocelis subcapitata]